MKIGIIGLGLIGGSMAKAITEHTDHTVLGADLDSSVVLKAKMTKVIEQELLEEDLPSCDMLILALYPKATVEYISAHAGKIKKGALVRKWSARLCGALPQSTGSLSSAGIPWRAPSIPALNIPWPRCLPALP